MQNLPEFSPCKQRLLWFSEEDRTAAVNDYLTQNGFSLQEVPGSLQKSLHLGGHWVEEMIKEVAVGVEKTLARDFGLR